MLHREKEREEHEEHEEQVSQPCTARDHNDRLSICCLALLSSARPRRLRRPEQKGIKDLAGDSQDARGPSTARGVLPGQGTTPYGEGAGIFGTSGLSRKAPWPWRPASIELKQGISCNCTSHYRYLSKLYAQEAKDSELLAAQQEQLVSSQPAVCETAIGCKVTLKPHRRVNECNADFASTIWWSVQRHRRLARNLLSLHPQPGPYHSGVVITFLPHFAGGPS